MMWLKAQPDFEPSSTMYENSRIGYDPANTYYQQATNTFWNRCSSELDSWRDQPLWSYVLHKHNIVPLVLGLRMKIPGQKNHMGSHVYSKAHDNDTQ